MDQMGGWLSCLVINEDIPVVTLIFKSLAPRECIPEMITPSNKSVKGCCM